MKPTTGENIFYAINYFILSLFGLSCLLPLMHIAALSLSDLNAITSGIVGIWPKGWSIDSYVSLIHGTRIVSAFKNSVIITVVGTALNMVFTIIAAYPLSRSYFYGRRFYTLAIVFTMLFGAGIIPNYLLVKSLGLVDTYGALWLPGVVSAWNLLVLKSFFEHIPEELQEAATIDGAGDWRLILQIIIPLSLPAIATLTLFYGVGHWNSFMNVLIYINDSTKMNLSVMVQQMIASQQLVSEISTMEDSLSVTPESVKSAGVFVMIVPMMLVYPFLQKYFVKGVMIGSIKG